MKSLEFGSELGGEACGVFGVYGPGLPLEHMAYRGLQALQHRGQAGAGIGVSTDKHIAICTELGKVEQAFDHGQRLHGLSNGDKAKIVTAHVRYPTHNIKKLSEALKRSVLHPIAYTIVNDSDSPDVAFTLSHNGHVEGLPGHELTDSGRMTTIIGEEFEKTNDLALALENTLPGFLGAYSLVLATKHELIAARDPQGFRPLHLGRVEDKAWVVASEIPALNIVHAEPVREIEPGEILTINDTTESGLHSIQLPEYTKTPPKLCGFEFVYFSRPDNEMYGETVVVVRERMGEILARNDSVEADMVIGVPSSGRHAADGYAWARGIRHMDRLVRNNYFDRSFIEDTHGLRELTVSGKLNPIRGEIKGKRLVIVDDSIVRGTTSKIMVNMLRDAGAREVHMRISSPPYAWPCFYGMDTSRREELIASRKNVNEIRDYIGADSLKYLTNDEMHEALGKAAAKVCDACTTGDYPTEVPISFGANLHKP